MKTLKHKAVVTILTAVMLMTSLLPAGCAGRKNKDMVEIQRKAEEFIYRFATGDADTVKDLVDGRCLQSGLRRSRILSGHLYLFFNSFLCFQIHLCPHLQDAQSLQTLSRADARRS